MRIAMANDHAGFSLKQEIKQLLEADGHEVVDFGTHDENACDLPDFVYPAALAVGRGDVDRGIFVDGVGYGSAMIANKISGVYAAVCQDPFCAGLARSHSGTRLVPKSAISVCASTGRAGHRSLTPTSSCTTRKDATPPDPRGPLTNHQVRQAMKGDASDIELDVQGLPRYAAGSRPECT